MTPTNDAPVTVEQCDAEVCDDAFNMGSPVYVGCGSIQRFVIRRKRTTGFGYIFKGKRISEAKAASMIRAWILDGVKMANHRLAALASAPAGDGVPTWHAEAAHKALLASSEPVGDEGVVDHIVRALSINDDDTAPSEDYRVGVRDCIATIRVLYPALARPRAAVGERNHLIEIVTEAIHDHAADDAGTARDHAAHAVTRILALQSPPAKVEG